ncbi:exodeoxyribonuclease V subunit beta [Thiohalocapsa sp. ML1]|uniref:exodeoxyribonuclease V subunit beta n=1 Tax=Thiohalocapsa sp. ML1 TaxID=1431688 RepID=UPI00073231D5|nr:exodeoxyribonuclease V subunit beta [Thiohalocapsa sp. ML1]
MSTHAHTGRALDDAAMLAFALDGVHLIEASAGTGKTYSIANLYLRQILGGRRVGEVLVVTFTNAATDELRGRLRARLFDALALLEQGGASKDAFLDALARQLRADPQTLDLAVKRLRLAVRAMDEAAVFSIHSFCQRALTEFAFNSGQGFGVEVLTDDAEQKRAAVQDWWRRTGYPLDPAKLGLFTAAVGTLERLRAQLDPLLAPAPRRLLPEVSDVHAVLGRFDALLPKLRDIAGEWRSDGGRLMHALTSSTALKRPKETTFHPDVLAVTFAALDEYFAEPPAGPPPDCFKTLAAEVIRAQLKKNKSDPDLDDPFFARCGEVHAALEQLRADIKAAALADAAVFVREELARQGRDGRVLSFDALLTTLRDALAGAGGPALAAAITARFPVAMIDEFQDTDGLQWEIFSRLYVAGPGAGLVLIGDPKQAIYSFRGGDIFTYMAAQAAVGAGARSTLLTNWRSTPAVVRAVNTVFERRPDAFVFDAIGFAPSTAADKAHAYLLDADGERPALTLWTLPLGETGKPLSKADAGAFARAACADEIARLLAGARTGQVRLVQRDAAGVVKQDRALLPRDIAALVRTRREGAELRGVLAARGIAAVSVERASVYDTEEAAALEALLQAVLSPRERGQARLALASPLLGLCYADIARIAADERAWADWIDGLIAAQNAWQRRGFMALFQKLLWQTGVDGRPIAAALAAGPDAERRLTNLLHLGELLQQASREHAGMDALLNWFRIQRRERAGEQAADELQLRLESDAGLVQIVTVHTAKGLQYPVVFLPDLWNPMITKQAEPLRFHAAANDEPCLDIGSPERAAHLCLAERERLAEDVRLAYVALTRAESAVYAVWGRAGQKESHAGAAAMGWLLHPHQSAAALATEPPNAFQDGADPEADLAELAKAAAGSIAVAPLPQAALPTTLPADDAALALAPRVFAGRIATDWRITSFSALVRDLHAPPSAAIAGLGLRVDDEPPAPADPLAEPEPAPADDDPALRYPAGSDVGSFLHLLLEHLDFTGDIRTQALELSVRHAARFGLDHRRHGADTALLMERAVQTPLSPDGLRLADLPAERRLNELAFDLAAARADIAALNALLAAHAGQSLPGIAAADFAGMVTGVIDLVFEHDGRFFVADYKSNLLGRRFDDYAPDALQRAVLARRYDLQYLLYTLALHRYLATRIPDYDYERHMGGALYLFLRGLRPETGPARGVFFTRPSAALIAALDAQVFPRADHGGERQ